MIRTLLTFIVTISMLPALFGQTGGEGVFNFLRLTNSARAAALGGIQIALPDADPELLLQNPALLSPEMNQTLSVSYARYLAGIGFGYGSYAMNLGKLGMAAAGIQFVDYGQFVAADENGLITGSFSASDYALNLTYAKTVGTLFTVGGSFKTIYSHLESYQSFGLAVDLGIVRHTSDSLSTIALCIKHLGAQITTYYDNGPREKLEWSLQFGYTRKLQYAPLRWSITAYDLNQWSDPANASDSNGNDQEVSNTRLFPMLLRHVSMGAEIFPEHTVTFRIGYNFRRDSDLSSSYQSGMTGFTTGLGIRLPAISFNYALSSYSQSVLVHNFSLSSNLSRLNRK